MIARLGVVGLAVVVGGCGGGSDSGALGKRSIVEGVRPLSGALVTEADIARTPPGSPARALLRYWSVAQQERWDQAVAAYEPGLREALGPSRLLAALRTSADAYRGSQPLIARVRTEGSRAEIRYFSLPPGPSATLALYGVVLRRDAGSWRIAYSAMLDDAMRISAQQEEQKRLGPKAQSADPRVLAAGARAARLQSLYLQRISRADS